MPAWADTAPPDPSIPVTVTSDPLPTVQINGVVWSQAVIGNTVYAGGDFTTARPAGAAAGTQTVTRQNLLAYNLSTGALITTFAPTINAQIRAVVASPDGSTLYVGGDFTTVNGATRTRLAAFDTATGALKGSFAPSANMRVNAMAISGSTLYLAGQFRAINGSTRVSVGAVNATTGAVTGFNPIVSGGYGESVAVSPTDPNKVVIGGRFTSTNGSDSNDTNASGYGMAMVDAATGRTNLPLAVNTVVRNAQDKAAITSLFATTDGFYGTGFSFNGVAGNFEGTFKAGWNGDLIWLEDCHGDTYASYQASTTGPVYIAGHPHYCGNIGGFPQTDPQSSWTYYRALAFSPGVRGVVGRDSLGYTNFTNRPRPELLNWFPDLNNGTFTGQFQGPWTVTGTNDYVLYGGEFTTVNGVGQQGLVRFAKSALAPKLDGPRLSGSNFVPTLQSVANGVRAIWPANRDRDNELLTYKLIRDNDTANPIFTTTRRSTFWQRPVISYLDTGVQPGETHTYKVITTDPVGVSATGGTVSITAAGGSTLSSYDQHVLNDDPTLYWRLAESSGTSVTDSGGLGVSGTRQPDVSQGVAGAISGDPGTAYRFTGSTSSTLAADTATLGLQRFSVESWFKTSSTTGGRMIGFSSAKTGSSTTSDRQLYLTNNGRVYFGTARPATGNPGLQTISSPATGYNNGEWHHVVATQDTSGVRLFIDGAEVASRSDYFLATVFTGYWRLGGDQLTGWPEAPTSGYYVGDLDDAAVYNVGLTPAQVLDHYNLGHGSVPSDQPFASDTFDRTVASGFGTADTGGTWTASSTYCSVAGGAGLFDLRTPGIGPAAYLDNARRSNTDVRFNVKVNKVATGSGIYLTGFGRRVGTNLDYRATVQLTSSGRALLTIGALKGSSSVVNLASSVQLADTIAAGDTLHLRMQVFGTGTTTLRAKLWVNGQTEPSGWATSANDTYAGLQTTGAVGMQGYASSNITNAPVTVSLLDITAKPAA